MEGYLYFCVRTIFCFLNVNLSKDWILLFNSRDENLIECFVLPFLAAGCNRFFLSCLVSSSRS